MMLRLNQGRQGRPRALTTLALMVLVLVFSTPALAEAYSGAKLRALDKITARVSELEVPINHAVRFGTIEVVARHCDKRPPEDPPEAAAFLEVWEVRPRAPISRIFTGWMFASTPGLSALEHPIYDVWVLDCVNISDSVAPNPGGVASQ